MKDCTRPMGHRASTQGLVSNMISVVRTLINHELDLIKEASSQHFEANYDQSEQAEILFSDGEGS